MTRKVRTYTKSINTEGDAPFVYRVVAVSTIVNVLDIEDLKFTRQLTCAFAYKLMIRYEIMTKWNVIGRTRCETGVYEQRLAKKQLVRNKWFSFTISDSKNFFDSLFRNSESRNKFFWWLVRINESRNKVFVSIIRNRKSRNGILHSLIRNSESRNNSCESVIQIKESRNSFFDSLVRISEPRNTFFISCFESWIKNQLILCFFASVYLWAIYTIQSAVQIRELFPYLGQNWEILFCL